MPRLPTAINKYETLLYNLTLTSGKDIITLYNETIQLLSQTIALYPNHKLKSNLILKRQIDEYFLSLNNKLTDLVINDKIKAQGYAIRKNQQYFAEYLENIGAAKLIEIFNNYKKQPVLIRPISTRIWDYNRPLKAQVELLLNAGVFEGRSAAEIATPLRKLTLKPNDINQKQLNRLLADGSISQSEYNKIQKQIAAFKPGRGVYRSSRANAYRLARTEINIAYRRQDFDMVKDLDFVRGWRVVLSGQHPRYDMCDDLQGDYPKKFEFTGWHPACICQALPILASETKASKLIQGQQVNINEVQQVPARAESWMQTNLPKLKNPPYWQSDNPSFIPKF